MQAQHIIKLLEMLEPTTEVQLSRQYSLDYRLVSDEYNGVDDPIAIFEPVEREG